ncbi:MAG TPA: phage major tail tube protein [Candidatus Binataceae bacterium]|nr:phage major tail tube protein [Candidatus Binataceae bacterium]
MALINVSRVTNANIYVDGASLLGRADEVELAWPKARMVDHKGLGMFGTAEFPAGIDKLEAKVKWSSIFSEVLQTMSIFQSHQFQVRASIEQYTSQGRIAELPFVGLMTAQFKDGGPLNFKQHEQVDFPTTLVVFHCEYYVAGAQYLLYDVLANMYVVNGVDQLINFRSNIGGL